MSRALRTFRALRALRTLRTLRQVRVTRILILNKLSKTHNLDRLGDEEEVEEGVEEEVGGRVKNKRGQLPFTIRVATSTTGPVQWQ
jgi:hypothetical protein